MAIDFQYGMYYVQIAFRDNDGYAMGTQTDPNNVANDTTTSAYLLENPVEFTPNAPSYSRTFSRGGQKIRAQKDLGINDIGEASLTLSEFDDTFHTYITGTTVDSATPSGSRQVAYGGDVTSLPEFIIILSMKVVNTADSSDAWTHWIYPKAQIRPAVPQGSQNDGENPNPLQYTIVPDFSTRTLRGELFSATSMGVTKDFLYRDRSSNPISVTTFVEAGTPDGAFTLGYLPLTDESTTSDKTVFDEGTATTITTCNVSTGAVTVPTADSGDRVVFVYETNFETA